MDSIKQPKHLSFYTECPFVPGPQINRSPAAPGILDGLTFAVKDLIDVEGEKTGCGNPQWINQATPANRSATCVDALLLAGATLIGKTITDEFAFSLEGTNNHYAIPLNPQCPDCMPGGSSSGSASVVAQGLADLALGTDTGGSVRIPAAFCGLYGIRPTHGMVSLNGTMPLAPSYDTIGWFAQNPEILQRAATVLFHKHHAADHPLPLHNLYCATDAFALAEPDVAFSLRNKAQIFASKVGLNIFDNRPNEWLQSYQILQGREIWETLGKSLVTSKIVMGETIAERFMQTCFISDKSVLKAQKFRKEISEKIIQSIPQDGALIIPTSPMTALRKIATQKDIYKFYVAALTLNSIAGHAGLPQVCIPAGTVNGCPVSLSLIGRRGNDTRLIATARVISRIFDDFRNTFY